MCPANTVMEKGNVISIKAEMCGGHKNNVHIGEKNVSLLFQARLYYLFL